MEILKCNGIEKVFGKGGNQVTALNGISLSGSNLVCKLPMTKLETESIVATTAPNSQKL